MHKWLFRFLCVLFAVFGLTVSAAAQGGEECFAERIHQYDVDLVVQENADLIVTETITVCAMGQNIRRGIYRDFPYVNAGPEGVRYRAGFKILEALRDGRKENHFVQSGNGIKRIFFGDEDRYLETGRTYTYTLKYKTTRQIRYFDTHDELYWDVTGNEWAFSIEDVEARVQLPEGTPITDVSAYTGAYGAQGLKYDVVRDAGGQVTIYTTNALQRREGLTISVSWPKGHVAPLSQSQALAIWLSTEGAPLAILLTLLAALAYYLKAWVSHGIDPRRGPVIPLFEPPEGMTPAAAAHVYFQDVGRTAGRKALMATLVDLARRGYYELSFKRKKVTFTNLAKSRAGLKPHEGSLLAGIFSRTASEGSTKTIGGKPNSTFRSGYNSFKSDLNKNYGSDYLVKNFGWCALGMLISAIGVITYFVLTRSLLSGGQVAQMSGLIFISFMVFFLGGLLEPLLRRIGWPVALFRAAAIGAFVAIYYFLPGGAPEGLEILFMAGLLIVNLVFFELMRAPTPLGAKIANEVAGFRMYLKTAEAPRMNLGKAPTLTTELFEEYLPYAIALDVEKPWTKYFEKTLPAEAARHSAGWIDSSNTLVHDMGRSSGSLTSALSSASGSASATPSSSSGGGGGGFSGGGGGGGGGGGW